MGIFFFALACAFSGLLFGYDAGIISGAMLFIKHWFNLSHLEIGIVVSALPFGALLAALVVGRISDAVGRRVVLMAAAVLFVMGSLQAALSSDASDLILGRLLLGFAVGMSSAMAPLYIAEISLGKHRGMLVTLYLIAINVGIVLAYIVNLFFADSGLWRTMIVIGALPAILLGVFAYYLPESPRWLMFNGKNGMASRILIRLHGATKALAVLEEMNFLTKKEKTHQVKLFERGNWKFLLLSILVCMCSQGVGIHAIIYYAPILFQHTGFDETMVSIFATLGIGLSFLLASIIASQMIDYFGRRKLLLLGLAGVSVSLLVLILGFKHIHDPHVLGWLMLVCSVTFVVSYAIGIGPAAYLIPAEMMPAKVRGAGMGVAIAVNWLSNAVVVLLFPVLLHHLGVADTFSLFLVAALLGWFVCYLAAPETRHVSLEQIEHTIHEGVAIRELGQCQSLREI